MTYQNTSKYSLYINNSQIDGKGLFTKTKIDKGDHIAPALDLKKHKVFPLCKFINHSWESKANTNVVLCGKNQDIMCLVAKKTIKPHTELTINYNGKNIPYWIIPADKNWK